MFQRIVDISRELRLRSLMGLFWLATVALPLFAQAPPSQDTFVSVSKPSAPLAPNRDGRQTRLDRQPVLGPPAARTLSLPLSFEKKLEHSGNQFIARGRQGKLVLKKNGVVLTLAPNSSGEVQAREAALRLQFAGANTDPLISGEEELPGKIYYARGDFKGSLTGTPSFRRVRYSQLYRGIDAIFYGNERFGSGLQCFGKVHRYRQSGAPHRPWDVSVNSFPGG